MLVPGLLALIAFLLSAQFYEAEKGQIGAVFRIAGFGIAGFTALSTFWFVIVWLVALVRRDQE